jgi:hypothetical protein
MQKNGTPQPANFTRRQKVRLQFELEFELEFEPSVLPFPLPPLPYCTGFSVRYGRNSVLLCAFA